MSEIEIECSRGDCYWHTNIKDGKHVGSFEGNGSCRRNGITVSKVSGCQSYVKREDAEGIIKSLIAGGALIKAN